MKLNSETDVTPKLLWHPVMNGDKACGDVLVTAELILRNKVHLFVLALVFLERLEASCSFQALLALVKRKY